MMPLHLRTLCPQWPELAQQFVASGWLEPGDAYLVDALAAAQSRPWQANDALALIGLAFAVRGPRMGHVGVDLAQVPTATVPDRAPADAAAVPVPWPAQPQAWLALVRALGRPLVGDADAQTLPTPFVVQGDLLYLHRMFRYQAQLADALLARAADDTVPPLPGTDLPVLDPSRLGRDLDVLFGGDTLADGAPNWQKAVAALAVRYKLTVLTGGPGTGKTTTLARMLAALLRQAHDPALVSIALCAPTGKAAVRMTEALRAQAATLAQLPDFASIALQLTTLVGATVDRLLGSNLEHPGRFRHHAGNLLPFDVVVVDEVSMVDLPKMAKLIAAVRPQARLVLVGDPDQLASVEAGCVLGDVRRGISAHPRYTGETAAFLAQALAQPPPLPVDTGPVLPLDNRAAHLTHNFRTATTALGSEFPCDIIRVARAMAADDVQRALDVLFEPAPQGFAPFVHLSKPHAVDSPGAENEALQAAVDHAAKHYAQLLPRRGMQFAARDTAALSAQLAKLDQFRVLCANRNGRRGVAGFNRAMEDALHHGKQTWYSGRPVLVTHNDYLINLFNGDVGMCLQLDDGTLRVAFRAVDGGVRLLAPAQLPAHETCYAMTIHKSQGSEFSEVLVVLPQVSGEAKPPILTRELLYTAVTRARRKVAFLAGRPALELALAQRVVRGSGLAGMLREGPQ